MVCTRYIFRFCKWLEHVGDVLTGAAGPVFVTFAVVLLSVGAFSFCEDLSLSSFMAYPNPPA